MSIKSESELPAASVRSQIRTKVKQVSKSRLDLEITPSMKIGVFVYLKTKIVTLPTLRKVDAANDGPVKVDRTYSKMADPDTAVSSKVLALRYGGEYVAIPEIDKEAMKFVSEKCLKVIGFFPIQVFKPHYLISNADCVAAEPGNVHAAIALSSLIHALLESNKVALCRFSFRANAEPKLVALFPHAQDDFECFYSVQVPFSEDSRENSLLFPSLPVPTDELVEAVDSLIDSRMLIASNGTELLQPEETLNPTLARFWATVEARVEKPDAPLAPPPDILVNPGKYLFETQKEAEKIGNRIKKIANLTEVVEDDEAKKKRKRYWREVQERVLLESPSKSIDVKKIRIESTQEAEFEKAQSIK